MSICPPPADCRIFFIHHRHAGYYSAYVYVIWRTVTGALSIGTLTFLTGAIVQASGNIQQIFSSLSSIADQALFLTDLLAFFDMQPTIRPSPMPCQLLAQSCADSNFAMFRSAIREVRGWCSTAWIFTSAPGERVALIGENGEGKTTIVKLITRLYDPIEGQVLLDGVDLREYNLEDLYREIGVIFQDFMRYEMTARENIAVGPDREINNLPLLEDSG